jgi:three-Cys-motif partner protein
MAKRPDRLVITRAEPDPCAGQQLPVEANEDNCGVGSWVPHVKHRLLCRYIDSAYGAARKWPGGWVYIDPFCGPGRIRVAGEGDTRPGGAAVAWSQSQASGTPFSKILIGDLATDRVRACERRLLAAGAPVTAFNMPALQSVQQMVEAVPKGALCLAYIDPYNLGLLSFDIMRTLAKLPAVDFIVNFFTSDLRRNVDTARDEILPSWRERLAGDRSKGNLAAAFFEDWQEQIRALGFRVSKSMQTVENSKNSEMYRLVFFARRDFPVGLWDDVAADPNRSLF